MELSVIIPTLNEEKNIEMCLKSALNQDFPREKYEIIVSDGGSKDKTVQIARKYADKVLVTKSKGVWYGRNYGAKFAKGKYLVFIDADTDLDSNYLKTVYPCLLKGYSGLSTGFRFSGKEFRIKMAEAFSNLYYSTKSFLGQDNLLGFSLCISKKDFDKAGGFKNLGLEDTGICDDLRKIGKVKFISKKLVTNSSRRLEETGVWNSLKYYLDLWLIQKMKLDPKKNSFIKNSSFKAFTSTKKQSPQ